MRYIQIHQIKHIATGGVELCLCSFFAADHDGYRTAIASLQEYIADNGWEILLEEDGE